MATIGDEIRYFANQLMRLAEVQPCYSVIHEIINNAHEHLILRAYYSDKVNDEHAKMTEKPHD